LKVVILTDIPSPYQVELFNALARLHGWTVLVIYRRRSASERAWNTLPILHEHLFLDDACELQVSHIIVGCDLAVFSGYRPAMVAGLIKLRNRTGKAWAFWGERPGFRFPGWLGRQYRAWALREVRSPHIPVWGIGEWAVDGYRSELGEERRFFNVPYASNLDSFLSIERQFERNRCCRFLFSGSFTLRKGIDLLVSAFARLVTEGIDAELNLMGTGPLEKSLRAKCLSFSDKVRVLGFKQWSELAPIYAQSDVLCAPSRYDGWGLVVVEGLAAGMPTISTDKTGAARELIGPRNGWLVRAADGEALYSAMRSAAMLDIDRRRLMSQCARQTGGGQGLESGVRRFARAAGLTLQHWRSRQPDT
jgi:glycosyltransferase involved in cell wall biosynthesis